MNLKELFNTGKNREIIIERDIDNELLINNHNLDLKNCNLEGNTGIISCENIQFTDIDDLRISKINNCDDIIIKNSTVYISEENYNIRNTDGLIFKNCTINLESQFIVNNSDILFKNCTIETKDGFGFGVINGKLTFRNCTLKNLCIVFQTESSTLNITYSKMINCHDVFDIMNTSLYIRMLKIKNSKNKIVNLENVNSSIKGCPELTIAKL